MIGYGTNEYDFLASTLSLFPSIPLFQLPPNSPPARLVIDRVECACLNYVRARTTLQKLCSAILAKGKAML